MKMEQWIVRCCDATKKAEICIFLYLGIVSGTDPVIWWTNVSRNQIENEYIYFIGGAIGLQFSSSFVVGKIIYEILSHCTWNMNIEIEGNFHKQHSFKVFVASVFGSPRTPFSLQALRISHRMHIEVATSDKVTFVIQHDLNDSQFF